MRKKALSFHSLIAHSGCVAHTHISCTNAKKLSAKTAAFYDLDRVPAYNYFEEADAQMSTRLLRAKVTKMRVPEQHHFMTWIARRPATAPRMRMRR